MWGDPCIKDKEHTDRVKRITEGEVKMKVTICIGSACHLKGSREIIEKLQKLVNENGLSEQVDLYSLKPEDTEAFFENEIKGRL